ncbi:putative serine/threonine-protein kinase GCN2 [Dendrobium catenatum]|uniref:Putative serine/threonine-protein kinase GCN2 n=1 Tax=Dendrobium catenatum TaxID=906689 RepID=A0A2I0W174_9ASPA|nr:putative serine/threonine-protein kinase GCN2 [Dendrobium catenatum]
MQIFLKEHMQVPVSEATLMAVGGRYDYLVHQKWNYENRSNPPGAVGTSLAMEKAEFVLLEDPSLTEQYEYAAEHDIKFLVIITEAGLTQTGLIKQH